MATQVFAEEELERLRGFPEIGRDELFRFFTLAPADVAFVDPGRGRGPADRLGLSVALCTLPWLGFVPDDVVAAPPVASSAVASSAGRNVSILSSFAATSRGAPTVATVLNSRHVGHPPIAPSAARPCPLGLTASRTREHLRGLLVAHRLLTRRDAGPARPWPALRTPTTATSSSASCVGTCCDR